MSKISDEIAFLKSIQDVTEEFEAAREVKAEDPERWTAASEAFQAQRSFWRQVAIDNELRMETPTFKPVTPSTMIGRSAVNGKG